MIKYFIGPIEISWVNKDSGLLVMMRTLILPGTHVGAVKDLFLLHMWSSNFHSGMCKL